MLVEYIFKYIENKTVKVFTVTATSKEEAEKKLKTTLGEDINLEFLHSKEINY
jgi:hypothetical protein